jgi:hypothetical protein
MMQQCVTFTRKTGKGNKWLLRFDSFTWEENDNDQVKALHSTCLGLRQTHL